MIVIAAMVELNSSSNDGGGRREVEMAKMKRSEMEIGMEMEIIAYITR